MKLQMSILFSVLVTLSVCRSAVLKQNSQNSLASTDPIVIWGLKDLFSTRKRRSHFTVNSDISSIASKKPSFQIDVRLFGKTQMFLQIAADGTVNGTSDCTSRYAKLQLQSMGIGHQRIKATETGRFVAMDNKGNLYSTNSPNDETIFKQTMQSDSFHTFASAKYYRRTLYDSFISIGQNGKARSGAGTNNSQNKVKFIVITPDSC